MARFRRLDVLQTIVSSGMVPIFYHPSAEVSLEVACACARGGARVLEFTHRGDSAHQVFEELVQRCAREEPELIVGVGSIRDPHTAALYLARGANFIVGPMLSPEVARLANGRKVAYMPGCGTATEVARAEELGCEIAKVFPGDAVGGPQFISAILGPSPWSSLMPTGGVSLTRESIGEWIRAGAAAVGIGSSLISKDIVKDSSYDRLAERASQALEYVQEARKEK